MNNTTTITAGRPSNRTAGHVQSSIDAMRETIRLNIDMDKDKHAAFKIMAIQKGKTMGAIVNSMVDDYLKNNA